MPKVLGPAWAAEAERASFSPLQSAERTPAVTHAVAPERTVTAPPHASVPPSAAVNAALPGVRSVPPLPEEPFERFVATVARVAMNRGATRAAGAVTALLVLGRLARDGLDPQLLDALARGRIVAPAGQVTPEFAATTAAWRAVLEGTGGDLSGCGSSTLDAWAAELLATVMNVPRSEITELKRELRRCGVAAFGLLAVA